MAGGRISVKGVENIRKSLNNVVNELRRTKSELPDEVAKFGANYARSIAPIYTGALIQAINWTVSKDGKAWVILRNPNDYRSFGKSRLNYGAEMQNGGYWLEHIKSGEPQFMLKTYDQMQLELNQKIKLHAQRILK